jgi:hypothetical protein
MKFTNFLIVMIILFGSCEKKKTESINNENVPAQDLTGHYVGPDNAGTLTITEFEDTGFNFEILLVTENANCTGELTGKAFSVGKQNEWIYEDTESTCALTFSVVDGALQLTESGACDHGAACSFSGVFKKSSARSKEILKHPAALNTIEDYYLALPDEYFTCEVQTQYSREERLRHIKYKNVADGYMKVTFSELEEIQLAQYKNREKGKSYLAFVYECGGGCMCNKRLFLSYDNGEWIDHYDEIFPDLSSLTANDTIIAFRLPEKGTTIEIYDYDDPEKTLGLLKWNGNNFTLE